MGDSMDHDRIVPLSGINNLRDYGGYGVAGGGRVKRGVLWRSGQHVMASDADLETIGALGLATVIDLRGGSERAANPCRRPEGFAAAVIACEGDTAGLASHLDAGAGVMDEHGARSAMCALYAGMPWRENLVTVLRGYLRALADREGASLIHCYAGKDRTGFAVALAHHVLGVHPDDALADYLLTNVATQGRHIPGRPASDQQHYAGLSEGAMQALQGVHESYLAAAFAALRERHGSVDAYLGEVLGVDAALAERIRAALLD